jgi:MoaA/NifB/PqqE/SkfB family radical SAM enzyme
VSTSFTGSHLDRLFERAAEAWVPLAVMVEVNHACPLDCVQCYIGEDPKERPLSLDEYRRVFDELATEGTLFLTVTGGEIFLRKDLLAILRGARDRGFVLTCFTSGTLITPALADEIAALAPCAVEITVYSVTPAVHDAITRRAGSSARTLEAVRLLRERGVPVVVKAPLMTLNAGAYREVAAFAESVGASHRFDVTIAPRRDRDVAPLGYQLVASRIGTLGRDPLLADTVERREACGADSGTCGAGRWACDISPSGEVYPCLAFPYGVSAGSLRTRSFREIWHAAPLMQRLRRLSARELTDAAGDCGHGAGECARCLGFLLTIHGDVLGVSR